MAEGSTNLARTIASNHERVHAGRVSLHHPMPEVRTYTGHYDTHEIEVESGTPGPGATIRFKLENIAELLHGAMILQTDVLLALNGAAHASLDMNACSIIEWYRVYVGTEKKYEATGDEINIEMRKDLPDGNNQFFLTDYYRMWPLTAAGMTACGNFWDAAAAATRAERVNIPLRMPWHGESDTALLETLMRKSVTIEIRFQANSGNGALTDTTGSTATYTLANTRLRMNYGRLTQEELEEINPMNVGERVHRTHEYLSIEGNTIAALSAVANSFRLFDLRGMTKMLWVVFRDPAVLTNTLAMEQYGGTLWILPTRGLFDTNNLLNNHSTRGACTYPQDIEIVDGAVQIKNLATRQEQLEWFMTCTSGIMDYVGDIRFVPFTPAANAKGYFGGQPWNVHSNPTLRITGNGSSHDTRVDIFAVNYTRGVQTPDGQYVVAHSSK